MPFDGIKELASLAKEKGMKGHIGLILLVAVVILIGLFMFTSFNILSSFKEKDITFEGIVINEKGECLEEVKISIEGARSFPRFTTTDGKYSFVINSSDLPGKSFQLVFRLNNHKEVSRNVLLMDNIFYHEIILK